MKTYLFTELNSPIEQFELYNVLNAFYIISIDNLVVTFIIILLLILSITLLLLKNKKESLLIIPTIYQRIYEYIYILPVNILKDNVNSTENKEHAPIIIAIFALILTVNLFGILPYSFTITSSLFFTLSISLIIFIGIQIISIEKNKWHFFDIFIPSGISIILSLLLVPIEIISFFFKPLSLAIRLFANLMAGHTLLKVVAGFVWSLMSLDTSLYLLHIIPLLVLIILYILESAVAIIQTIVFAILCSIYINDVYSSH